MENNILPFPSDEFEIFPVLETSELLKLGQGSNHKKLLVVLQKLEEQKRSDAMVLLTKIMKAVNIDLEKDLFLLELSPRAGFNFKELHNALDFQCMISFGLSPNVAGLNFQTRNYEIKTFSTWKFLFVDDLPKIGGDQKLKGALWTNLQQLFKKQ